MGNIVLLDDLTINKIAAGEVIETPASVIKEMVENSIDAGANNITVEIKNGGISFIKISDNGKGIAKDDLEIAFERHATSKIRSADDLDTVKSMGFRGEALASIAAIANVELISKTKDQDVGYKLVIEGGDILEKDIAPSSFGTTITVRNLFFNTPVRYKFLKKDYTEAGYIEDVITKIALVHPEIAIKLINSGKTIIQTSGNGDLKTVIYSIYGKDISNEVMKVEYEYEDIKIEGMIGSPKIARSNRSNQIFFVNKRHIKDKALISATEQAYKGMIPLGKFGFVILNLTVDPSKVDVNVHPAKLEVRFQEESKIFQGVYHAIKDTLLKGEDKDGLFGNRNTNSEKIENYTNEESKIKTNLSVNENENINMEEKKDSNISENFEKQNTIQSMKMLEQLKELKEKEQKNECEIEKKEEIVKEEVEKTEDDNQENNNIKNENSQNEQYENKMNFDEMYEKLFGKAPVKNEIEESKKEEKNKFGIDILKENVSVFDEIEEYKKPVYKFIGIVFNTYIIIEMKDEMYIIDQHAAHERVMYERVKKNYYSDLAKDSQLLLLPDLINLTHKEMDVAKENMEMFKKAGFIVEEFGENTLKLTGVPTICLDIDNKDLFLETLDEINTVARTAKQEKEEKFLATVACKAAVKAHMVLAEEEVNSLMDELLELPNPFSCPHGRPTAIKMSKYDIERKFARK